MKVILAFLLLFSALAYNSNNYTYYVLVLQWQGSICHLNDCNYDQGLNSTFFSIHGLWPTDPEGTGPSQCLNTTYNQSLLSSQTQQELVEYWSGLYSNSEQFHAHEFEKHGTCWVTGTNATGNVQEEFFSKVLSLAIAADVYGTLKAANITPRYDSYSYWDVMTPLQSKFQKVQLTCQDNFMTVVNICLDLEYNYMDCPDSSSSKFLSTSSCGDDVNYPIFNATSQAEEIEV